jgi:hypothetical protein
VVWIEADSLYAEQMRSKDALEADEDSCFGEDGESDVMVPVSLHRTHHIQRNADSTTCLPRFCKTEASMDQSRSLSGQSLDRSTTSSPRLLSRDFRQQSDLTAREVAQAATTSVP